MSRDEQGGPADNGSASRAARSATSIDVSADIEASWRDHHGSPCSCGCDPVRGERLTEVMAYVRSQVSEAPAAKERRERQARIVEEMA